MSCQDHTRDLCLNAREAKTHSIKSCFFDVTSMCHMSYGSGSSNKNNNSSILETSPWLLSFLVPLFLYQKTSTDLEKAYENLRI